MYEHLSEKYTNAELYGWLKKEAGSVYKSLFQLALKVARKAEKCYHFEIGDTDIDAKSSKTFIKGCGAYWDGLRSGLLAGEKLLADLHVMEVAYLENDRNELEITRPVSLWEINSNSEGISVLTSLKNIDSWIKDSARKKICYSVSFDIKKSVFFEDFTQPYYFGRIRRVSLQILCDSGDRLSAELSMDRNVLDLGNENGIVNRIGVQTLATSTANVEYGKYNFDFNKDKFAPFEGAGLESRWNLTISAPLSFIPDSIKDVIIQISYTARNG